MIMAKFEHNNHSYKLSKKIPFPDCEQSRSALIDLLILFAVTSSCGFLMYPYATLLISTAHQVIGPVMFEIKQEFVSSPTIYVCISLTIFTTLIALLALTLCTSKKCGQPGCRGLQKNIEFDIHIEKEDSVKNSKLSSSPVKKGLFELPKDLHRGLEVELKKIAPVNGRVIMVFRAKCGCAAVRIEVSGPKKSNKKFKK
uniref:Ribosomal protein L34e superfamily protein n=1 Tax=Tanacetum cinerariifolium TaxID=118510 RepID=A0A6L2MKW4_TANCI|nr:ribosomal protein L34e superfamily protein [Tanacetum cinerariifolium]